MIFERQSTARFAVTYLKFDADNDETNQAKNDMSQMLWKAGL